MRKVMAGGTFNIIHPGHIRFLEKARSLGDYLIVVVAHDSTVLNNKGILLAPADERKRMLESIKSVDSVVIGRESDFFALVEREKPDVIALGYDQLRDREWVLECLKTSENRPEVVMIEKFGDYSTRRMMEEIKNKR